MYLSLTLQLLKVRTSKVLSSTVASVSSQDSGINLSFQEHDCLPGDYSKRRCSSESMGNRCESDSVRFSTLQRQKRREFAEHRQGTREQSSSDDCGKWLCTPKSVWQGTVEALQEYDMINDGDKILVCLSGGKDSLSLLHVLLQYQSHVQNKGISFTLGAVTINPETCQSGYNLFASHVRSFGIHYIVDTVEDDKDSGINSVQQTTPMWN